MEFCIKISKNYYIDFSFLSKYRPFNDGIDFLDCKIILDTYEMEHNPGFKVFIGILNIALIDIRLYRFNKNEE